MPLVLRVRGVPYVCHATPCDLLASIIANGGLTPSADPAKIRSSMDPLPSGRIVSKGNVLSSYVGCAFPTSWWMSRQREQDMSIIVLDAAAVCNKRGARFCPGRSTSRRISIDDILRHGGLLGLLSSLPGRRQRRQGKNPEVFVPGLIQLKHFRGIYVYDNDSVRTWQPVIDAAVATSGKTAPARSVRLKTGYADILHFPADYAPAMRVRPPVDRIERRVRESRKIYRSWARGRRNSPRPNRLDVSDVSRLNRDTTAKSEQ